MMQRINYLSAVSLFHSNLVHFFRFRARPFIPIQILIFRLVRNVNIFAYLLRLILRAWATSGIACTI